MIRSNIGFAVIGLDHGHAWDMTQGLMDAGALLTAVYDPDQEKVANFCKKFPQANAWDEARIFENVATQLIVSAGIPNQRAALSERSMRAGKDFFSAKPPFTTLEQLEHSRKVTAETGRKFFVFYSERLNVASALMAGELITTGMLGEIVQVICLAPHRLIPPVRPAWFYNPEQSGGILCDLGSHQFEQILTYGGMNSARINYSFTANKNNPNHPEFDDFGEVSISGDNGVSGYLRVDWLTPQGSSVWGDGRTFVLGTKASLEIRKYVNVATDTSGDHLFLVDAKGEHHLRPDPHARIVYFEDLLHDCLERTEQAMTQKHAFYSAELALKAELEAKRLKIS